MSQEISLTCHWDYHGWNERDCSRRAGGEIVKSCMVLMRVEVANMVSKDKESHKRAMKCIKSVKVDDISI